MDDKIFDSGVLPEITVTDTTPIPTINESGLWAKITGLGIKNYLSSFFATDTSVVHKTGDEIVDGRKNFLKELFISGTNSTPGTGNGLHIFFNSVSNIASFSSYESGVGWRKFLFNGSSYEFQTNDTKRVEILNNGFVGINKENPRYRLEVNGGLGVNLFNGESSFLDFRPQLTAGNEYNLSIGAYDHSGDGNRDGISINGIDGVSICTGSNTRNERVRINGSGNIGIGTTTPRKKLDVSGDIIQSVGGNILSGDSVSVVSDADNAMLAVNYFSWKTDGSAGFTQNRDFGVFNGKGGEILKVKGNENNLYVNSQNWTSAWTSWTPTRTNGITVSSFIVNSAAYIQKGKSVEFRMHVTVTPSSTGSFIAISPPGGKIGVNHSSLATWLSTNTQTQAYIDSVDIKFECAFTSGVAASFMISGVYQTI